MQCATCLMPDLPAWLWLLLCVPWLFVMAMLLRHLHDRPRRRAPVRSAYDEVYDECLQLRQTRRHAECIAALKRIEERGN